jgi:4-amino-4-deoxy-L-arabinose transferase-like glycosyltransferase
LRLLDLGTWSFWIDEAHTWRDATMPLHGEDGFLGSGRAMYPLAFLMVRGLLAAGWIGGDEASLRLPFALLGIATVPLLAFCGRRLVGNSAAVLAAVVCAVNPWHVYWSQNARGYAFVVFFACIAANRVGAYAVDHRRRDLLTALLAVAAGTLFHPTSAMQFAGIGAFLVLRRLATWSARTLVRVVAGIVVAGAALPFVAEWLPFQEFLRAKDDPSLMHFAQTTGYYFRPLLLLGGLGIVLSWQALGRSRAMLLACLAIVPFFVLVVIGGSIAKVTARYAICALPIWIWLASFACVHVGAAAASMRTRRRKFPVFAALPLPLLLLLESCLLLGDYYTTQFGQRARWREACEVAQQIAGDDPLRVLTVNQPTAVYYLHRDQWAKTEPERNPRAVVWAMLDWLVDADAGGSPLHEPGAANHLRWHRQQARLAGAHFVVIVTLPELEEMDADGAMWRALRQDFEIARHLPCWVGPKDESIYVFVPSRE